MVGPPKHFYEERIQYVSKNELVLVAHPVQQESHQAQGIRRVVLFEELGSELRDVREPSSNVCFLVKGALNSICEVAYHSERHLIKCEFLAVIKS